MTRNFFLKFCLFLTLLAAGAWSVPARAVLPPAPPVLIQLNVPANLRRVELNWQASPTAGVLYRVYRSESAGSDGSIIADNLVVLFYVDTNVNYGTVYYYRLAAVSDGVVSALTTASSAAPNLNGPVNVSATDTTQGGEIKISWERPTAGLVLTYNVYRSESETGLGAWVAREVVGLEFTDAGLENTKRYYYRVKAVDSAGREGAASALIIGAASDKKAPAAPVLSGNFESPDRAYLSWSTPANERGLSYILYRSLGAGSIGDQVIKTTDTNYRQYVLALGATYYYSVTAADGGGNVSAASNQIKIVISPASVVVNTPKATEVTAAGTTAAGEILLRWRLPNDSAVAYSRVYRGLTANSQPAQVADRLTGSSYLDKTVQAGERYYYFIRLVGKDGGEYQASDQVNAVAFDPANRSQGSAPARPGAVSAPGGADAAKFYAYNKPRMDNLRLEAALAGNLRKFLGEKLGRRGLPRTLHPVLVKAYLYGGYSVAEIAHTIVNGPGLVHPAIPAVIWRQSEEYRKQPR